MARIADKSVEILRCPACHGKLQQNETEKGLHCLHCNQTFPVISGIPRLLLSPLREALLQNGSANGADHQQVQTALSFGFEWTRFPEMYAEWEQSFLDYMQPHSKEFFRNKRVLDAGCGNGRFAYYAAKFGGEVWAIDLGPAVEVARRNTANVGNVQVVQADLYCPPFAPESFDFIYSIGVLHHLPAPEAAFQNLLRYLKPGGEIQIYLYWQPERQPIKRGMLAAVTMLREITRRLPHQAVHALAFPAALAAYGFLVWPYRILKHVPGLAGFAERIPMKQYARFPFRVCVNDQLDRFSAPIENRYTRQQVIDWLKRAGLQNISTKAAYGWVASGQKPSAEQMLVKGA